MVEKLKNNILLISILSGIKSHDCCNSRRNISLNKDSETIDDNSNSIVNYDLIIDKTKSLIEQLATNNGSITKHLNYMFNDNENRSKDLKEIYKSISTELKDSNYTSTIFIISAFSFYSSFKEQSLVVLDNNKEELITYPDLKRLWCERNNDNNESLLLITDFSYSGQWINENIQKNDNITNNIFIQSSVNDKEYIACDYDELGSAFLYNFVIGNNKINDSRVMIVKNIPNPSSTDNSKECLKYFNLTSQVSEFKDLGTIKEIKNLVTEVINTNTNDIKDNNNKTMNILTYNKNRDASILEIIKYDDFSLFEKKIQYSIDDDEYKRLKLNCKVLDSNIDFSKYTTVKTVEEIGKNHIIQELFRKYSKLEDNLKIIEIKSEDIYYLGEVDSNNNLFGRAFSIYYINSDTDGQIYDGYFYNNQFNFTCTINYFNEDKYIGEIYKFQKHGNGEYKYKEGTTYKGNFELNMIDGYGEEAYPDGLKYKGYYKNDKKEGNGECIWPDGSVYKGNFKQNMIDGYGNYLFLIFLYYILILIICFFFTTGEYYWSDKRTYKGNWINNKMHGFGYATWIDGRSYEGDYVDDKKEGNGIYTWANGKKYEGQWLNGKQHGYGKIINLNGEFIEGEFEFGRRVKTY